MKINFTEDAIRKTSWETLEVEDVMSKLSVTQEGLTKQEAQERLEAFGENKLPVEKKAGFIKRFLSQFNNALIYVLLAAAVLTAFLQHWVDTWVIVAVVVINAIIGYIQEDKAEKALENIKHLLSLKASIIRDGRREEISAENLVIGDLVILKAGDKIPADLRLIETSNFQVEEASLTGESEAVSKKTEPVAPETVLGERLSMAYTGTTVRAGSGKGIVIATASDTELGKINTMLSETHATTTPLIRKINGFGKVLSLFIILFSAVIFLYGILVQGLSAGDTSLAVIGLAVAAIPEGLPAILTITLAIGVQRMAKRNAIIRRLPSVETLGSVTVICSDKTGTLTRNEMTATNIYTRGGEYQVEGAGYEPIGSILKNSEAQDVTKNIVLLRLLQSSYLCNDSELRQNKDGFWDVQGAPTEGALKALAEKAGLKDLENQRLDTIPFDSTVKYMSTLNQIEDERIIFVNGAPERLLALCSNQLSESGIPEPIDIEFWNAQIEAGASQGQRMLGSAFCQVENSKTNITHDDLNTGMVFIGVTGLIDPPRPEAIEAIKLCKQAGITAKMITGDHVLTAKNIGKQMGIGDGETVISGAELEKMDDQEMQEAVKGCHVFARTSPEHKLRLVKAIQANGEICAMTGDGVNDAPALKKADIGIAMGIKGTEVTKDSAAMVLADDNFASILSAVEEGRTIYNNLRKTLLFILPTNGAEAFVIFIAILFGTTLPISPVQILWVNMVTAVTLGITLSFEPTEKNTMNLPPRDPKESMLGTYFTFRIIFVSIIIGGFTLMAFMNLIDQGYTTEMARCVAVNSLVAGELFYLYNCRKINGSLFGTGFFNNRIVFIASGLIIVIQIAFTYLPIMNFWFGTEPISLNDWMYPIACGLLVLIIVEIEKFVVNKLKR